MFMNRRGVGLIEVMVSVAIMSIIMVGATQMITSFNKNVQDARTLANKDQIAEVIAHYATTARALDASATAAGPNSPLRKCISGTGTGLCVHGAQSPFELRTPPLGLPPSIAGAATYYTRDGALCLPPIPPPAFVDGSEACPIRAQIWFRPRCYGNIACVPMVHAEYLTIDYMITRAVSTPLNPISGLAFRSSCTAGAPPDIRCPPAAANPSIVVAVPMFTNLPAGVVNRAPFWDSTSTLAPSTLEIIPGNGNVVINRTSGDLTGALNCNGLNNGAVRTHNGSLQICDGATSRWKFSAGRMESSLSLIHI